MDDEKFSLNDRHFRNLYKVLGWRTPEERDRKRLTVEIEGAVSKCITLREMKPRSQISKDDFYATPAGQTILRQKAAIDAIHKSANDLLEAMKGYVSEKGPFSDDRDEFIHDLLGRIGWRDDQVQGTGDFDANRSTPSSLTPERQAEIFANVVHHVELAHFASSELLDSWNKTSGRPKSMHNDLIIDLHRIVIDHISPDHPRFDSWIHQPAAPNGPLCHLFEVLLEAMGEEAHSNPSARVRSAIAMHESQLEEMERHVDGIQPKRWNDSVKPEV